MATKHDEAAETLVDEATRLLAEIAMGNGVLTPKQAVDVSEFIAKSYRRNHMRNMPQVAA